MSVAEFRVRVAEQEDLSGVVEMERAIAEAPHWGEAEYAAIVAAAGDVDGALRRCLLVAEREGRLLGFAVGKMIGWGTGGVGELESVAVDPGARRGGVGGALCRAVVAWCREHGASSVDLEVRAQSGGAIALYAGLGFVASGRRGWYYKDPTEDAVLMRLDLGRYPDRDE